jgi:hypothetical protein
MYENYANQFLGVFHTLAWAKDTFHGPVHVCLSICRVSRNSWNQLLHCNWIRSFTLLRKSPGITLVKEWSKMQQWLRMKLIQQRPTSRTPLERRVLQRVHILDLVLTVNSSNVGTHATELVCSHGFPLLNHLIPYVYCIRYCYSRRYSSTWEQKAYRVIVDIIFIIFLNSTLIMNSPSEQCNLGNSRFQVSLSLVMWCELMEPRRRH